MNVTHARGLAALLFAAVAPAAGAQVQVAFSEQAYPGTSPLGLYGFSLGSAHPANPGQCQSPDPCFGWSFRPTVAAPGFQVAERLVGQQRDDHFGPQGNFERVWFDPNTPLQLPLAVDPLSPFELSNTLSFYEDCTAVVPALPATQFGPLSLGPTNPGGLCHPNRVGEGSVTFLFAEDQLQVAFDLFHVSPAPSTSITVELYDRTGLPMTSIDLGAPPAGSTPLTLAHSLITLDASAPFAALTINNIDPGGVGWDRVFYSPCPPAPAVYCQPTTSSSGCVPQIGSNGLPSESAGSGFDVFVTNLMNGRMGSLFYGYLGPQAKPFFGGTLCVKFAFRRLPVRNTGGTPPPASDCSGTLSYDFNARIASGIDPKLVAGTTVWCQFLYRDPVGLGMSDALEVTLCP
jgi:hypothetical protein